VTAYRGSGVSFRRRHRADLLAATPADRPSLLEIIPAHFFADPALLDDLAAAYPLVFHEVGLSIGTAPGPADATTRAMLARVRALVARARPILVSDHLALTRAPSGADLGHLCPLHLTRETLTEVADRVHLWQETLGAPIALENIAMPFELPGELSEPAFMTELVARTGSGLLLDLTNLVVNAKNFAFDPVSKLEEYPLEAVWQVHLAGGSLRNGFWVDSHSTPVGKLEYELLAKVSRRAARLRAIIVERDENVPDLAELVAEARQADHTRRTSRGSGP
jgi:uncharacterized protein (UPF0276 family)